jgi:hypothetical protein
MDGPHWERKFVSGVKEHELRVELYSRLYKERPHQALYRLVPYLALRVPVAKRKDRYRLRAEKVARLPEQLRLEAESAARQWIATVGALAEEAARYRVNLRPFLATYHLSVIRDGVIAVPIGLNILAKRGLSRDDMHRLAWGLALVQPAVQYNSLARQQRQPIYFTGAGHQPAIGPILREPNRWRARVLNPIDRLGLAMRLPRWGRWRWDRWLRMIDLQVVVTPNDE